MSERAQPTGDDDSRGPGAPPPWPGPLGFGPWTEPAPSRPEPAPRRSAYLERRYLIPTLLIGLVLAAISVGAGWPIGDPPAGVGSPFVADGTSRTLLGSGDPADGLVTIESTHVVGANALDLGGAGIRAGGQLIRSELEQGRFYVGESRLWLRAGGRRDRETQLLRLNDSGVAALARTENDTTTYFTPGLPVLPDRLGAGSAWEATGLAARFTAPGGKDAGRPYYYRARAEQAGNGCLRITASLTLGTGEPTERSETRCRGRGIVEQARPLSGRTVRWAPIADFPSELDPRGEVDLSPPRRWPERPSWRLSPLSLDGADVGSSSLSVDGSTADGTTLIGHTGAGIVSGAQRRRGGDLTVDWTVYPGGQRARAWAFGDLVVTATLDRQIVAYDSTGQWLWTHQQRETTTVAPVLSDDTLVVLNQDGTVTGLAARTGEQRWGTGLRVDTRLAPALCGATVVVATERPQVLLFAAADGRRISTSQVRESPQGLVCLGEEVVVWNASDTVALSSLGSGRWQRSTAVGAKAARAAGDHLLMLDQRGLRGYTGAGALAWSRPGDYDALTGDGRLVLGLGPADLTLYDQAGRPVGSVADGAGEGTIGRIVPTADGVWFRRAGRTFWAGAP